MIALLFSFYQQQGAIAHTENIQILGVQPFLEETSLLLSLSHPSLLPL